MAWPEMAEILATPKIAKKVRRQIEDGATTTPGSVHPLPDQIRPHSDWRWAEGCEIGLWQTAQMGFFTKNFERNKVK